MRILTGAATAAALMLCSAALAQTDPATPAAPTAPPQPSRCGEIAAAPVAPDPASASSEEMQAAISQYETWSAATTANLACRRAEALELRALSDARAAEYNAATTAAQTASTAFVAAVETYRQRAPNNRRRGR